MNQPFRADQFGNLIGTKIASGTNKKNETYDRFITLKDGYDNLAKLVAGQGKEPKRVNQCLTIDGARAYAAARKNWTAHEADITGKNGIPDGVNEVFVCDAKGNLKVINGYKLAKSDYPWRKAYRHITSTKAERKEYPYTQFLNDMYQIHDGLDANGHPYYEFETADIAPEFRNIRPAITPKNLYKQFLFKPLYDSIKEEMKANGVEPMVMAQLFNRTLSDAYNRHVKYQVMAELLGDDPTNFDEKTQNKCLRSAAYKEGARNKILEILQNQDDLSACQQEIHELIGEEFDKVVQNAQARQQARAHLAGQHGVALGRAQAGRRLPQRRQAAQPAQAQPAQGQ